MLSVKNVSKDFQQNGESFQALGNVFMKIKEGEFAAIVGPSGCGKTTLLKIIAGLLPPTSGTVELADKNPRVGFVFQEPNLLEWRSVEENIRLPLELNKGKIKNVERILKLVEMTKFKEYFPEQISGGMQQRVAIARALIHQPSLLLLDEPFSALDDFSRENLNLMLTKVWEKTGKTILFVTHNIEEAVFLADKIIVLGERPARVKDVLPVSLPRPRNPEVKHSVEFQGHIKWIKSIMRN